ncbi:glycosyltransferase [bacterium]|nr:glycosyltransferase [bacterium]
MAIPFVSVIVPAYNAEKTMALCIESLISQNYPKDKYEIIIVDNNSKDETAKIIKKYPVKYLLEDKMQTSYAARNSGIRHAKGEIIAFTDSDCIADKNWIKEGIKPFYDEKIGGVGGNILSYKPETWIEYHQDRMGIFNQKGSMNKNKLKQKIASIVTANAFYRKSVLNKTDLFDAQLSSGGDADMSKKVQNSTSYKLLYNNSTIVYHKHRSNLLALCEQFHRYGYGNILFVNKYSPEKVADLRKYGLIKNIYWKIRFFILTHFFNTFKYLFLYMISFKSDYKVKLIDEFLFTIEQCMVLIGQLRSSYKNKVPFIFY